MLLWATGSALWLAWYYHFAANRLPLLLANFALAVPILAFAGRESHERLKRILKATKQPELFLWLGAILLTLSNASTAQRQSPGFIVTWAAYLALPLVTFRLAPTRFRSILVAMAIVFPIGLVQSVQLSEPGRQSLNLTILILLDLVLLLFLLDDETSDAHLGLWLSRKDTTIALSGFALFLAVGLPLGLLLHFVRPGLGVSDVASGAGRLVELFFFVALPEEAVFRGLVQHGLERRLARPQALVIAAIVFGLAHIGHPPAPNWRYVLLATGAGVVYGRVFQRTRNLAASAMTHALVDWTWYVFFAGMIGK